MSAWWQPRCRSRAVGPEGSFRCDGPHGHDGDHHADYGMHDIQWSADTWVGGAR